MSNPYRKRYTVNDAGEFVEKVSASTSGITIISDIQPFQTQEGTAITSRAALREYEQKHGVRQIGNDWSGSEKPAFWDAMMAQNKGR